MAVTETILTIINDNQVKQIADLFKTYYPQDIAEALEDLETEALANFLAMISNKKLASILEVADDDLQRHMLEQLPFRRITRVFRQMSHDDIVDILGNLPVNVRKEYLNLIKSREVESLLQYDANTAGGLMTTEFITLRSGLTTAEAFETIKRIAPRKEVIETLFIVDNYHHLIGTVDIRQVFSTSDQVQLKDIMNDQVMSVTPDTDQEAVSLLVSKYSLSVVPVVNKKGGFLGIITVDDIIDVINEEHTEDMLLMGGVNSESDVGEPVVSSVKRRLPWLLVNLATAFIASTVVSAFSGTIDQFVALAAVMPVIAGMGGNSGTQTVTLVVRAIALDDIRWGQWGGLWREMCVGVIDGMVTGLVAGIFLYLVYGNIYFSFIMILAMTINLIIAGTLGYCIPLVVKRLNWDPALVSSVFLTTATDVCGFFCFLGLATVFMPFLV